MNLNLTRSKWFLTAILSLVAFTGALVARADDDIIGTQDNWKFTNGPEFKGAEGGVKIGDVAGKKAATVSFDFSKGGGYVAAGRYGLDQAGTVVKVTVQSATKCMLVVRVADSTKQYFQYKFEYTTPNQPQTLTSDLTAKPQLVFGGDKSGTFNGNITEIWIGATKHGADLGGAATGDVVFSDFSIAASK